MEGRNKEGKIFIKLLKYRAFEEKTPGVPISGGFSGGCVFSLGSESFTKKLPMGVLPMYLLNLDGNKKAGSRMTRLSLREPVLPIA